MLFLTQTVVKLCLGFRHNRLSIVFTHFKSCDQSLDQTSLDLSNIFRGMQCCAMSALSSIIILQIPKRMVT